MSPSNQSFFSDDGLGGGSQYLNWVPRPQFVPSLYFNPATQVGTEGGFQLIGPAADSSHPHSQLFSAIYPRPAAHVNQQAPMLTAQQQQKHSIWLQLRKQGCGFADCKAPFEWTVQLHNKFMKAVTELGGLAQAKPVDILKKMSVCGLTRLTIKSHLQTCRRKQKSAGTGASRRNSSDSVRSHICKSSMRIWDGIHGQNVNGLSSACYRSSSAPSLQRNTEVSNQCYVHLKINEVQNMPQENHMGPQRSSYIEADYANGRAAPANWIYPEQPSGHLVGPVLIMGPNQLQCNMHLASHQPGSGVGPNEAALGSFANNYSLELEEAEDNLVGEHLKLLEAELDRDIGEEEYLEFTTPCYYSHII